MKEIIFLLCPRWRLLATKSQVLSAKGYILITLCCCSWQIIKWGHCSNDSKAAEKLMGGNNYILWKLTKPRATLSHLSRAHSAHGHGSLGKCVLWYHEVEHWGWTATHFCKTCSWCSAVLTRMHFYNLQGCLTTLFSDDVLKSSADLCKVGARNSTDDCYHLKPP